MAACRESVFGCGRGAHPCTSYIAGRHSYFSWSGCSEVETISGLLPWQETCTPEPTCSLAGRSGSCFPPAWCPVQAAVTPRCSTQSLKEMQDVSSAHERLLSGKSDQPPSATGCASPVLPYSTGSSTKGNASYFTSRRGVGQVASTGAPMSIWPSGTGCKSLWTYGRNE